LTKVARHPHLAFKGMDTEEVYDVLMEHLVSAVKGYDPDYKAKVKLVVEVINNELSKRKQFAVNDVNRHLDVDGARSAPAGARWLHPEDRRRVCAGRERAGARRAAS